VSTPTRLTALVSGQVQGVGFREWTRAQAERLGLTGWAENRDDGQVEVVAEGPQQACRALLDQLRSPAAPGRVAEVAERWDPGAGIEGAFRSR